ncbi:nitrous oxide reductase family maturation protein NosD [Faunimonas sp. B44]|uniref:nitrous oxide reductase family maturation protein NosD n=1 Tax=Faunimonas sp. B44 TaxID=3461493 RepID=UPI0040441C6D
MALSLTRVLVLAAATLVAAAAGAAETVVPAGGDLAAAVARAAPGDVLRLEPGVHAGAVTVDKRLTLAGSEGSVVAGPGTGSVITVTAPDVRIESLEIRGSGKDLPGMDSGVLVKRTAGNAAIIGNRLAGNLFGVYLHGAANSLVEGNLITGRNDVRLAEKGNGVSIWNAPGSAVVDNEMSGVRDGIFVTTSKQNRFENNRFSDLRFAIHYMYTHDSRIAGNVSRGNHVGYALMYSNNLEVVGNASIGDRDHGLMLNTANSSEIRGNSVENGGEKCVFVYNANKNRLVDNRFEGCPIGIHFTAGSERNAISGNAFIGNRSQVKYVGTRFVDWAAEGRGNYWSDNPAFDLDGDGIADQPYRPNDVMDEILWTLPQAKALVNSPAVHLLRAAQSRFPALKPGGVIDSAPLMRPPQPARSPS